jgi:aminopeptidase N
LKNYFLFILLCVYSLLTTGQEVPENISCATKNIRKHSLKSATLSKDLIQLTENYDVHYYNFNLEVSDTNTFLSGNVYMESTSIKKMDTILFELFSDYTIQKIELNGIEANYIRENSAIKIPFQCDVNTTFSVNTFYYGYSPNETTNPLGGSGYTSDMDEKTGVSVSYTLSEPFSAYEWFPCKQALNDKIDSVDISLTIPINCLAGANGILTRIDTLSKNKKTMHWKSRYPIDYYLISFSVAEYLDYSIYAHPSSSDSILIQNYIYNTNDALSKYSEDIQVTATALEKFTEIYGLYPFSKEKYGHCSATLGGGMEHQTMTTILNFDRDLVTHELAHQWWGNQVTCGSWTDIWLNEGFATYSEYLFIQHYFPELSESKMEGFHALALSKTDGSVYVLDSLNEQRIFSKRLTYYKGAAIIHILRYLIDNDTIFFKGLRNFQKAFSYSTAKVMDFKKYMEEVSGKDLTNFFNEWYYGEGYPIYSISLDTLTNSVEIHQQTSSTTELFTTPIELLVQRKNNLVDTIIRIPITNKIEKIQLPNSLEIKEVLEIDPNNWVLNKISPFDFQTIVSNKEIQIFPNPCTNHLQIKLQNPTDYQLEITTLQGKLIFQKKIYQSEMLDVSKITKGEYLLRLRNSDTQIIHTIQIH